MTHSRFYFRSLVPKHSAFALGCVVLTVTASTFGCAARRFNSEPDDAEAKSDTGLPPSVATSTDPRETKVPDDKAGMLLDEALKILETTGASSAKTQMCPALAVAGKLTFEGGALPASPDVRTLAFFSALSSLAYKDEATMKPWAKSMGFSRVERVFDKTTDTPVYVLEAPTYVVVAFSGTSTASNWATDLDLVFDKSLFGMSVHKGFLRSYRGGRNPTTGLTHAGVREALLPVLKKHGYPGKKLFLTGHSLGGALTSLLAADLALTEQIRTLPEPSKTCRDFKEDKGSIAGVITFGVTRIGGHAFADCYNKVLGAKTWRVVNNLDMFPLMASRQFYAHTGQRVHLSDAGVDYKPGKMEEPNEGLFAFMSHLAKGGLIRNALDHVSYTPRLSHALDPTCEIKHPIAVKLGL